MKINPTAAKLIISLSHEKATHVEDVEDYAWMGRYQNEMRSREHVERISKELDGFRHLFDLNRKRGQNDKRAEEGIKA